MIKVEKNNINTIILLMFIFISSITLPIKKIMDSGSIVWILTVVLLIISLIINKKINSLVVIIALVSIAFFLCNIILVDYKSIIINQMFDFIKFALIPLYLASNDINEDKLSYYMYKFSIINFIILLFFIPSSSNLDINYMSYGTAMTYSFIGFIYNYYISRNKCDLILSYITIFMIFIFANRGALLVCTIIYIFIIIYIQRGVIRKSIIIGFGATLIILVKNNLYNLLIKFNELLIRSGISSYSLTKYIQSIENGIVEASSGRDDVFNYAIEIIKNNPIKVNGFGYFTHKTNIVYPHNIILDMWIIFGIIGTIILIILFMKLFFKAIINLNKNIKIIVYSFFIHVLIRLSISGTFITETLLWIIIGIFINCTTNKYFAIKSIKKFKSMK